MGTTTLLLDGDVIAYKFAYAGEESIAWDGDGDSTLEDASVANNALDRWVDGVASWTGADKIIVALSDASHRYWRHDIYPRYKAHRKAGRKPVLLGSTLDHLRRRYECYVRNTLEADDVLGILSTHPRLIPGKKIVVSSDKDLETIPGWFLRIGKGEPRFITEEYADYRHLYQTLIGDTCDGFPGLPGVGPKKAEKILADPRWASVVAAYESKGLTEADALVQARLARICRWTDYDYVKKEVKLWTPS